MPLSLALPVAMLLVWGFLEVCGSRYDRRYMGKPLGWIGLSGVVWWFWGWLAG